MTYSISNIGRIIKATFEQKAEDIFIGHILLDSRKLLYPGETIFFALGGPRRNGALFIHELYAKGVRAFVVGEATAIDTGSIKNANLLVVKNVPDALHSLASYHRKQFHIPVIGITGSNGKTIVKEWLYQLLHDDLNIVRSPKSYNSQIGVPLSVWQMSEQDQIGIFEAGISHPGEMERLEKIIAPSIGVFTSIGEAHAEGFLNVRQKINEKLKLFIQSEVLIYHADDPNINEAVNNFSINVRDGSLESFSWGKMENATVRLVNETRKQDQTVISLQYGNERFDLKIPFADEASVENAITCCCVMLKLRKPVSVISERMSQLRPVEMRLELKQGINNCSVINDSYSADINSLAIALDFLQQQQQHEKRTLILSDILQSGRSGAALYQQVAHVLQQKNINRFIGIGPEISRHQGIFSSIPETNFFASTTDFKQQFHSIHFHNETILLKGARVFEFEQISHLLEQKVHQTVLEINLNAITHNLKAYQNLLKPGVQTMAMVKAFSYGSGSFEIANLLQFHKIDYLAVAYADEGVELRKSGISLPIMVMNAEETSFDAIVQHQLEPELFSFDFLSAFQRYLGNSGIQHYPVHIKLDTGMHRLGFEANDIDELCKRLLATNCFKIQTVFSHLAASDMSSLDDFTKQQAVSFQQSTERLQAAIGYPFRKHISNTSAIHRHPELQFDMVRLGIGLYGVDSLIQDQLRNVTTLKTTISQIKKVKAGESVGYSRKGIASKDSVIATVRIGYADGYPRLLSNGAGRMLINGKLAPVIGNVCMDMTMLDITGIRASEGDEVIVFGEELPVSEVANWALTIPYEILTGVSQRVQRVYFEE